MRDRSGRMPPGEHTPSRTAERPSDHRLDRPLRVDRSGYRLLLSDRATHRVSIQASPTSRPPGEGDRPGMRPADRSNPPFRASLEPAESTVSHPCHDVPQTSALAAHTVLDRPAARPAIDCVCARPPEVSCLLQRREALPSFFQTDRSIRPLLLKKNFCKLPPPFRTKRRFSQADFSLNTSILHVLQQLVSPSTALEGCGCASPDIAKYRADFSRHSRGGVAPSKRRLAITTSPYTHYTRVSLLYRIATSTLPADPSSLQHWITSIAWRAVGQVQRMPGTPRRQAHL